MGPESASVATLLGLVEIPIDEVKAGDHVTVVLDPNRCESQEAEVVAVVGHKGLSDYLADLAGDPRALSVRTKRAPRSYGVSDEKHREFVNAKWITVRWGEQGRGVFHVVYRKAEGA